jgi:periplasmic divalent cation tolerance protein
MKTAVILVYSTVPDLGIAQAIADDLVERGLAACVSILPGVESRYRWHGKTEVSQEFLLMIKTLDSQYIVLESELRRLHPYECPEIMAVPVQKGFAGYLDWIKESCSPDPDVVKGQKSLW